DRRRNRVEVFGESRDEDRFELVTDEGRAGPFEEMAERVRGLRSIGRDDAAIRSGDRERKRGAAPRPWVVSHERCADRGLGGEPLAELIDLVRPADLDPAGVDDRGRESGREVVGTFDLAGPGRRRPVRARLSAIGRVAPEW